MGQEPVVDRGDASETDEDRRRFLGKAGRFALVVPPAMTLLLSTSMSSNAIAQSAGAVAGSPNSGGGAPNGGYDFPNHPIKPGLEDRLDDIFTNLSNLFTKLFGH